jgi:hypothetical protein
MMNGRAYVIMMPPGLEKGKSTITENETPQKMMEVIDYATNRK